MAKAQISKISSVWRLTYYRPSEQGLRAVSINFPYFEGAVNTWRLIESKTYREQSAWSKLQHINRRYLNCADNLFIHRLDKSKCINITKRQYGYLSGIYERQVKE